MKKIVRLTESDLTRIVKRVIKEEDEMEDMGMSITIRDIFNEVVESINEYDEYGRYNPKVGGGYNESMKEKAMDLAFIIMSDLKDLALSSSHYTDYIRDIIGDEDYDEGDEIRNF
jgi:hypothetical protein